MKLSGEKSAKYTPFRRLAQSSGRRRRLRHIDAACASRQPLYYTRETYPSQLTSRLQPLAGQSAQPADHPQHCPAGPDRGARLRVAGQPHYRQPGGVTISLALLALLTIASLWRTTRPWPVADNEFLAQLMVDVLGWTSLMYFSGGANNPFVSYYIVPLVIAAAVLPWRHTWIIAGASLLAYSLLLYFYVPFPLFTPHAAMGHGDGANVHILGMWFNFLFSAGLITYFVVRMASTLRLQDAQAVTQREDRLRDDQIMAVASLAAGTAHELGTPLSTMTVLVDEMLQDPDLPDQAQQDCELLKAQLTLCRSTLSELSRTAELSSAQHTRPVAAGDFARQTLERWAVRRPGVIYSFECAVNSPVLEAGSNHAPGPGESVEQRRR